MTERCPDCAGVEILRQAGNGKCNFCYGSGRTGTVVEYTAGGPHHCRRCEGTGKCQTCLGEGVVPARAVERPHANSEINPFDDKVAIRIVCPKCQDIDWFEWKFLGKLTDPVCGYTWYVDSGTYTGQQLRATGEAAKKWAKYMTAGVSGEGAGIGKLFGSFCGGVFGISFRLPFAVLMIPVQAAVRATGSKQPTAQEGKTL